MSKGLIIIGYPGIGKTSCGGRNNCIDLESSCFWIAGERAYNWYIPYCQMAMHLANQGYTVFTSSHFLVQENFKTMRLSENVGKIVVFCPTLSMKDKWIERLKNRFNNNVSNKNLRALERAEADYDENIKNLLNSGLPVYQPANIDYDLINYVAKARHDWCGE